MDALIELVNKNAYAVVLIFVISFAANLIQISTYFRDRRRFREEDDHRKQLLGQLEKYKYIVGLAEKNIKTEEQLRAVEEDIRARTTAAQDIDSRIKQMRLVAQRQLVQNAIDRSLAELSSAHQDIQALRLKYEHLGPLPDMPDAARVEIEREVSVAIRRPYELPKEFVFRALLMLMFVFALPWPVDNVITLVFLHVFLGLFFEAAQMHSDRTMGDWVMRHHNAIGRWSAMGAWYALLNNVRGIIAAPLLNIVENRYTWTVTEGLLLAIAVLGGLLHWRAIRNRVIARPLETTDVAAAV